MVLFWPYNAVFETKMSIIQTTR